MKKIIVTGVTGQDGSHMVDYLLKNTNHEIYGSVRRLSVKNHDNILHLENEPRFHLIDMDLNDAHSMRDVILDIQPDYFINFRHNHLLLAVGIIQFKHGTQMQMPCSTFLNRFVDLRRNVDSTMLDQVKNLEM